MIRGKVSGKVTGSWGHYAHHWMNPFTTSQLNVLLGGEAWLEEMDPLGVTGGLELAPSPLPPAFPMVSGCHGLSSSLFYHILLPCCFCPEFQVTEE